MFDLLTSPDSGSATSLPELESGVWPCVGRDGRTIDLFGQGHAPVNLSARQARESGLLTSGTFGPPSSTSLSSAALQSSLESRLRARTQILGSTLYAMTWKPWNTGSGRSRSRLRASARRTSETGSSGWPTPITNDSGGSTHCYSGWNPDGSRKVSLKLPGAAKLTGWPTPQARDFKGANEAGNELTHNSRPLNEMVRLTGWTTPDRTMTQAKAVPPVLGNRKPTDPQISLADQAFHLAGWGTPTANQPGGTGDQYLARCEGVTGNTFPAMLTHQAQMVGPARLMACGRLLTGSDAAMDAGGQLNPAFSRWLMGLPPAWDECAPEPLKKRKGK